VRAAALVIVASGFFACADDPETTPPSVEPKHRSAGDDDDAGTSTSASSSSSSGGALVDAATGGAAVSYRGTLDKTGTSQFGGGSGHCTYNVAMSAIEIELAITPEGNIIGGSVNNSMTESIVGTCAFAPLGTKPMSFSFASAQGQTLTWAQAATGAPKTNLTITLTKTGQSYDAAVKWVRADRTDDLQWTVATKVTIGPK
jgi:hypothetical protein